jgi:hypothetical protein
MTARFAIFGLFAVLGCQNSSQLTSPSDDRMVVVDGRFTLTVTDFPAQMGILWVAPSAEGGQGAVIAHAIRYGSLCALAVSARAEVTGNRVALHVDFAPRLTLCVAEVRGLRYDAAIGGLAPGRYEVHILHDEGDGRGESEVRVQSVDVT